MDDAWPRGWRSSPLPPTTARCTRPVERRAACPLACSPAARPRSLWFPGATLDAWPHGRRDARGMWRLLSSTSGRPCVPGAAVESATARPTCPPARRGGDGPGARGDLARHHKGAQAQGQPLLFLDESGFSPWPRVVRTSAPIGHTPILRAWWTRDHLSAISAIAPEGTRSCQAQDHARHSADVVAFVAHLRREVPGQMVMLWDGSPIHRSQTIQAFLAHGASPRLHLARLPASAPALNPDAGVWPQLTGVERRHLCCVNLPHLRRARRDAVTRVRRTPHLITSFCRGAKR